MSHSYWVTETETKPGSLTKRSMWWGDKKLEIYYTVSYYGSFLCSQSQAPTSQSMVTCWNKRSWTEGAGKREGKKHRGHHSQWNSRGRNECTSSCVPRANPRSRSGKKSRAQHSFVRLHRGLQAAGGGVQTRGPQVSPEKRAFVCQNDAMSNRHPLIWWLIFTLQIQ